MDTVYPVIITILIALCVIAAVYHFTDRRAFNEGLNEGRRQSRQEQQQERVNALLLAQGEDLPALPVQSERRVLVAMRPRRIILPRLNGSQRVIEGVERRRLDYPINIPVE